MVSAVVDSSQGLSRGSENHQQPKPLTGTLLEERVRFFLGCPRHGAPEQHREYIGRLTMDEKPQRGRSTLILRGEGDRPLSVLFDPTGGEYVLQAGAITP